MAREKTRVLIEVNGGVVTNVHAAPSVDWSVLDWDNLLGDHSTPEETKQQWEALPAWVRTTVFEDYEDDYRRIIARIAEVTA